MPDLEFDMTDIEDGTLDAGGVENAHGTDAVQVGQEPKQAKQPVRIDDTKTSETKPTSVRDTISSALKGEEITPPVSQQGGEPARGPDGKFISPVAQEPTVQAPVAQPPSFLSPQDQQVFSQLPAELQTSVARTFEGLAEREARTRALEQVEHLIAPRRQAWLLGGMTEAQAIGQLLALSEFATASPAEFIQYFASQNQIDLEELAYGTEPVDPQYAEMQQKLQTMEQRLRSVDEERNQQTHNTLKNGVIAFAQASNEDGSLKRPYFQEIGEGIYPYIQTLRASQPNLSFSDLLQGAYDMACWSIPAIREKLLAANNAAQEAQRVQDGVARVAKSRSAGVSVASGVPANPANSNALPENASVRDTIRAAIHQHS